MSSSFLAKLLESTPAGRIPEIVLPDAKPELIQSLINLIYTGETCIAEELRYEFFDLCHLLQLHGVETFHENTTYEDQDFLAVASTFVNEPEIDEPSNSFTPNIDTSLNFVDLGKIEEVNNESSDEEHKTISTAPVSLLGKIIQEQNNRIALPKKKLARIKNKNMLVKIHDRLEQAYRRTYNKHVKSLKCAEDKFKGILVMNGSTLMKGQVICVVCQNKINVYYAHNSDNSFRQWANRNILKHLLQKHPKLTKSK